MLLLVALAGLFSFWPDLIVERSDPYVRLLHRAVASYYADRGQYPSLLTDAQPYLTSGSISHVRGDEYRITIRDSDLRREVVLDARYKLDANGVMEELYVHVTDHRRM